MVVIAKTSSLEGRGWGGESFTAPNGVVAAAEPSSRGVPAEDDSEDDPAAHVGGGGSGGVGTRSSSLSSSNKRTLVAICNYYCETKYRGGKTDRMLLHLAKRFEKHMPMSKREPMSETFPHQNRLGEFSSAQSLG